MRSCVPNDEMKSILKFCHDFAVGGHHDPKRTTRKNMDNRFFWLTTFKDAYKVVQ